MNTFLWVILPYLCLATFVVGHFWRYRYDKFGWTTRSSQLYEDRLLRWGSPLFHFGLMFVVLGHLMGLLIPQSWTDHFVTDHVYHLVALIGGVPAAVMTLVGMCILIYRRRVTGPVFSATTPMDKIMYLFLGVAIVLGTMNTIASGIFSVGGHYNYREGVSIWFRQWLTFHPDANLMVQAPLTFQLHAIVACLLFALWPFTRLVHVFSAPLGYVTRPYVVYRSRDRRPGRGTGAHAPGRGWESSVLPDTTSARRTERRSRTSR